MDNENKWEYDYSSANSSSGETGYPNVGSTGMNTANTAGTYGEPSPAADPEPASAGGNGGATPPPADPAPRAENAKPAKKPRKKNGAKVARSAVALVLAAAMGFAGGFVGARFGNAGSKVVIQQVERSSDSSSGSAAGTTVSSNGMTTAQVAEMVSPSVVVITTEQVVYSQWSWYGQSQVESGAGSGVIISSDGYILTCAHVVSGASQITVTVGDTDYTATVVGEDDTSDVAVLKIDATGLTPATVGDSDGLAVGDNVLAVGNPLGELGGTVTKARYGEPQGRMTIIPPEKTDDGKITIGGLDANVWMTKYGNVYTDCKAEDFMGKLGFAWGDLVTVKFLDKTLTLPVVPTYSYVDSGKPAIIVEKDADGKPTGYVSMAINMGNFAETYELAKKHTNEDKTWYWTAWEGVTYPVEVTFKMAEKGGYMAEYIMHDLQRTNDRADYPNLSDAEFGNFRNIATTGMGKDVLYRGSSPINPELGRNTYVDAALKQAGVNVIMNLANSQEEAEAYEGFADTYYSGQKVIYLNLGVDFSAPEFQKGLAEGLRFFAANKGTYYVHCTEGKDRAGFVSALLECLMGATYDEVVADYMVTYYNYYGVEPGTDKYNAIANSNIIKTLQNAFGVEDLSKADLQKGAKDYMKAIGLTDAEITDLMVNLGYVAPVEPVTPSKPATGDAGIVVYLGLGVMALAGGVLVAKKKEQF